MYSNMDKADMQRTVESLRHQLSLHRTPISQSGVELKRFVESQQDQVTLQIVLTYISVAV